MRGTDSRNPPPLCCQLLLLAFLSRPSSFVGGLCVRRKKNSGPHHLLAQVKLIFSRIVQKQEINIAHSGNCLVVCVVIEMWVAHFVPAVLKRARVG
ncbi:Hypothetical predicted protein [Cloeon dipterum]|uniref:Secreted protein n=1 Tax=Cloeon dipterum TaxID=197152 RepID=A0A8S1C5M8_9INSE|nr:Hypothetical predicted protein [Cloeon dipterum]